MASQILAFVVMVIFLVLSQTFSSAINGRLRRYVNMPSYKQSISDLENLELFELQVVWNLTNDFPGKLPIDSNIQHLVHAYLKDFNESIGFMHFVENGKNEIRASESPICAYRLMLRITVSLRQLVSRWDFGRYLGPLWRQIMLFFLQNRWPHMEDVEGFAEKILRIQHVYDLAVGQLANGRIDTVQTNCTLNSAHCYEIANFALKTELYASAIQWLQLAKEKAIVDRKSSIPFIELALSDAIEMHNMELHGKEIMGLEPVFFDRKISHVSKYCKNAKKLRNVLYGAFKGRKSYEYSIFNYWGICTGDIQQTEMEKSYLFCWYEFKIHPSFVIGPIKLEFLARNPDIIQIFEVFSEKEMDTVITECDRMPTHEFPVGSYKLALPLTSYQLSSGHSPCIPSEGEYLDRKLERMTGLNIKGDASENYMLLSYSVGGHINPHFDWQSKPPKEMIQELWRVATMMFYLNDVKKGGETAFTSLGANAEPVKGSAVLWYNHFSDGSEDMMSYHGGCPVLIGSKWAANRWIRYNPQFLKRKCGLKKKERYQVAVNGVFLPTPPLPGM